MLKTHPLLLCFFVCNHTLRYENKSKESLKTFFSLLSLQVHRLYRGGGGSLERAQEEWSTGLWKSAPVREAGFNAVAQTAQGPTLPEYPAAVPSYPDNSRWWWLKVASRWRQRAGHVCGAQASTSNRHTILTLHNKMHRCIFFFFLNKRKRQEESCHQSSLKPHPCSGGLSSKIYHSISTLFTYSLLKWMEE